MKRTLLSALMITLLLTGCGGGEAAEQRIEARRDVLAGAEEIAFTAAVTADLGDEVFECTLACAAGPETVTAEVLSPQELAGVRAHLTAGEAALEYDGVLLTLGSGFAETLSPAAAMPLLAEGLRVGHVIRAWTEQDGDSPLIAAELYASDDDELTVWYDAETLDPVHATVWRGGRALIQCEIQNFTYR